MTNRHGSCYLCGQALAKPRSKDHLPPKCFFSTEVMEVLNPVQFWTLPTHVACNNSFKDDEEYLVETMRLRVRDSWAGGSLQRDFINRVAKRAESQRLFGKTLKEMRWERFAGAKGSGGILVDIEHDQARIDRVCFKIVRGLHYREHGVVLPADFPVRESSLVQADRVDPKLAAWWDGAAGRNQYPYPQVFDYRYGSVSGADGGETRWMLLLWRKVVWQAKTPISAQG